ESPIRREPCVGPPKNHKSLRHPELRGSERRASQGEEEKVTHEIQSTLRPPVSRWTLARQSLRRQPVYRPHDTRSPDTSNGVQPSPIAPHLHSGRWAGRSLGATFPDHRSEELTSELQSLRHLVCRLLLE